MPYQEIQALCFPNSPRKLGLYEKRWACISWYGPCTQSVNSSDSHVILDTAFPVNLKGNVLNGMTFKWSFSTVHSWYNIQTMISRRVVGVRKYSLTEYNLEVWVLFYSVRLCFSNGCRTCSTSLRGQGLISLLTATWLHTAFPVILKGMV